MQTFDNISVSDVMRTSRLLENHDVIFHQFWELGNPIFTEDIPTACVSFDKKGECIDFLFNPSFWKNLSEYQRAFIIAHECLHVFLNHGARSMEEKDKVLNNVALDLAVNHSLINNFGFEREKLGELSESLCFIDNIFGKESKMSDEENYEFYMRELKKNPEKADKFKSIDSHEFLGSFSDSEKIKKAIEKAIKSNKINPEELKKFLNRNKDSKNKQPGDQEWINEIICSKRLVKQTKSWLRVVKKLVHKHCNITFQERWGMYDHRRNSFSELLPSEKMILDESKEKIKVAMFLDSSGSCYHLAETFFRASESIPRETFDVELYSFDTRVNKIGKDRKIKGGGGTSFSCISKYIDSMGKKPELVFVITDGYGGKLKCTNPNKWAWFLSTSYKADIPHECKVYSLKDFYDE